MSSPVNAQFAKYQALGNDMIVIDPATFDYPLTPAIARLICDRHLGLGADGICYGPLSTASESYPMRFINPDGTDAEKSGNGLRIFARYLWDKGYVTTREYAIRIGEAVSQVWILDEAARTFRMTMGPVRFDSATIPMTGPARDVVDETLVVGQRSYCVTAANVGNPHCVIFDHDVSPATTRAEGPAIEVAPQFPNRTNVQFAEAIDRHYLRIEIWERGAGYTLASGSSSCAAAGAAIRSGRCDSPVTVTMAGGEVTVEIDSDWQATLTGTVEAVASGAFAPDLLHCFDELTP